VGAAMSEQLLQPVGGEDPKIGMLLQEKYKIVRKLGEGGMGAVYEGEHVLIKRRVAIKCLHPQFAQNPEIVARFHREALAATSIGHENIIEVTDMGRFDDGTVFMVLEFLEGRDWSHDIDQHGAQSVDKVITIVNQICDALQAAHAKGIIHRDLKPENVFLITRGGNPNFVKVLDFGISKFKDNAGGGKAMTQTGATLGTPYYMAPEQAQGKKDIDHRADIYSLGVMVFQALTGQYPFDDDSYPMLVLKICTEQPPSLRLYRPDLPVEIEHVVNRLLAKQPADRFPDCASVKAALAPFAHLEDDPVVADAPSTANAPSSVLTAQQPVAETPAPTPTPTPTPMAVSDIRPPTSKAPLIAGVAALILVGGGLGVAAATGAFGGEAPEPEPVAQPTTPPPIDEVPVTGETFSVTVVTEPPGATLHLDGQPVSNPYQGRFESREHAYVLLATKDGYEDEQLLFRPSESGEVTLTLEVSGEAAPDEETPSRMRPSRTMRPVAMTETTMTETPMTAMAVTMESVAATPPVMEAAMTEPPPRMDPPPAPMMDGLLIIDLNMRQARRSE